MIMLRVVSQSIDAARIGTSAPCDAAAAALMAADLPGQLSPKRSSMERRYRSDLQDRVDRGAQLALDDLGRAVGEQLRRPIVERRDRAERGEHTDLVGDVMRGA